MAQIEPGNPINNWLIDRVIDYLHTRDSALFPFTASFDPHQRAAFARDLQEALGEINDSGSARKTSATGFVASDETLRRVISEWQFANGAWPVGSFPEDPVTALGSSTPVDSPGPRVYTRRIIQSLE